MCEPVEGTILTVVREMGVQVASDLARFKDARLPAYASAEVQNWVIAARKGALKTIGANQRPVTEVEWELARMKQELAEVKLERDLLKKAAAYFAKESLPGTRS